MAGQVVPLPTATRLRGETAAAFLAQPDLATSTRRSYQQTLGRLERELGADRPLATLTAEQMTGAVTRVWGGRAPATWNRHVATVRSFFGFCRRRRWLVDDPTADLERRPEPADRTKAIPLAQLERLWRRDDLGVREKALWRLLYETAARASEALSINVEDLELDNKHVRVRSKGGDTDWLHFQTGSARLLPRLIAGRARGPLFLADRAPVAARAPAAVDRCPDTGRARLSYRRAEALFRQASGGWTLHQLRHSALTQLAEQNVSLPLLMAKSRHASLRSLQRYARPGPEAVAALTAATDRAAAAADCVAVADRPRAPAICAAGSAARTATRAELRRLVLFVMPLHSDAAAISDRTRSSRTRAARSTAITITYLGHRGAGPRIG